MTNTIILLSGISLILILGIAATILSRALRIPNILFLLFLGLIIGNTRLSNLSIFSLPPSFVIGTAIITLAMVVFEGSSRFTWHDLDSLSSRAVELTIGFLVLNIVLIVVIMCHFYFGFTAQGLILSMILGAALSGTDPASVFIILGDNTKKVLQLLKVEALINTPIIVLLPFLFIDLLSEINSGSVFQTFIDFVGPFMQEIIVGIGTGVLVGIIVFKIMKRWYSESLSPVAIVSAALLSYVLSENLRGNGVLAVAVLGVIFGNTYVKSKGSIKDFSSLLSYSLEILVFVMLGIMIKLPSDKMFWEVSMLILVSLIISRTLTVMMLFKDLPIKNRVFMIFSMPKGIALAVVALSLLITKISGMILVVNMMIALTIYTILLSTITSRFGKQLLNVNITQKDVRKE